MIRQQMFQHFYEQQALDIIDRIYEVAPSQLDQGEGSGGDQHNERKGDIGWITPDDNNRDVFEKMFEFMSSANNSAEWFFDVQFLEPLQFTKYGTEQKYDWHVDQMMHMLEENCRKISFSLLLNDPNEFEGGELQIEVGSPSNPERVKTVDLKKGDIVFFPSYLWHRVMPVTKGERHSLVGWFTGPTWR